MSDYTRIEGGEGFVLDHPAPVEVAAVYRTFGGARTDVLLPTDTGARFVPLRLALANGDGSSRHASILLRTRSGSLVRYHAFDVRGRSPVASFDGDDPASAILVAGWARLLGGGLPRPLSQSKAPDSPSVVPRRAAALARWADVFEEIGVAVVGPELAFLPGLGWAPARFARGSEERLVLAVPQGLPGLSAPRRVLANAAAEAFGFPSGGPGWEEWVGEGRGGRRRPLKEVFPRPEESRAELAPSETEWD